MTDEPKLHVINGITYRESETFGNARMRSHTVTISGATWADPIASQLSELGERPLVIYPESFTVAGITFWATRTDCRVKVIRNHYDALKGLVSIDMQPQDAPMTVRAEWWRRTIFHVGMPFVKAWRRVVRETKTL